MHSICAHGFMIISRIYSFFVLNVAVLFNRDKEVNINSLIIISLIVKLKNKQTKVMIYTCTSWYNRACEMWLRQRRGI